MTLKIFILSFSVLWGSLCFAADLPKVLGVATGNDYAPYADAKLPSGGLTTALVKAIYEKMGQKTEVAFLPWSRSYDMTYDLSYDVTVPWVKTPERLEKFEYMDPLITIAQTVFARPENQAQYQDLQSLKGKTMCLPIGWALATPEMGAWIKNKEIKTESPTDISACLHMVADQRADFVISDELQGRATLVKTGLEAQLSAGMVINSTHLYVIVSKKHPQASTIVSAFNAQLKSLKDSGEYQKIIDEFLRTQ
jgi:polar amino acid transport system substrate-binding protein